MKKRVKPHAIHRMCVVLQSCPHCAGVLQFTEEGTQRFHLYCCQIGHRYSTSSLLHSKETQLERSLWSAAVLLKQMVDTYQQLLKEMPRAVAGRKVVQRRIKEVRKQSLAIQGIIETTHVAQ